MSPATICPRQRLHSFPRVSGDEPLLMGEEAMAAAFSPRERG